MQKIHMKKEMKINCIFLSNKKNFLLFESVVNIKQNILLKMQIKFN